MIIYPGPKVASQVRTIHCTIVILHISVKIHEYLAFDARFLGLVWFLGDAICDARHSARRLRAHTVR